MTRERSRVVLVAAVVVVGALGMAGTPGNTGSNGPAITWSSAVIEETIFPGTVKRLSLNFTSDRELSDVSLFVVPEIGQFLLVQPSLLGTVPAQTSYTVQGTLQVPLSAPLGDYRGTLHVRNRTLTIPDTLKILIHVVEPTGTSIPEEPASPSPDRIGFYPDGQRLVKDELAVILNASTTDPQSRIKEIATSTGAAIIGTLPGTRLFQLRYEVTELAALRQIATNLEVVPDVDSANRNFVGAGLQAGWPNDPFPGGDRWNLEFIKAPEAWEINTGDRSLRVGVVGPGFRSHEDLQNNVDQVTGWYSEPGFTFHASWEAGVLCAEGNNGKGITGITWRCGLTVWDSGQSADSVSIVQGMRLVALNQARVIDVGMGFVSVGPFCPPGTPEVLARVQESNNVFGSVMREFGKHLLWVFAAGNECRELKYQSPASLAESAEFSSNAIAVAAVGRSGSLWRSTGSPWWGSNFESDTSPTPHEAIVAAPGEDVLTTVGNDSYALWGGTSAAAPHVSGLAHLVLSQHPEFSAAQVKSCIVRAAKTYGPQVPGHGFHVINAPEAVKCETGWVKASPVHSAPPRWEPFGMAWDAARRKVLLVGSNALLPPGQPDTWTWDGSDWTKEPYTGMTPPSGTAVFDERRGEVVLFEARGMQGARTWVWDGSAWTIRWTGSPSPSTAEGRFAGMWPGSAALAYDATRGQVVLFGGRFNGSVAPVYQALDDTWLWDGTSWSLAHSVTRPPARMYASMVYDARLGEVVLFGGRGITFTPPNQYSMPPQVDTWVWNGMDWSQRFPTQVPPPTLWGTRAATFDAAVGRVVTYGCEPFDLPFAFASQWSWDGTNWQMENPSALPPTRCGSGMAFDTSRNQLILFGGQTPADPIWQFTNETWVLQR